MTETEGSTAVTIRLPVALAKRLREAAGADCRSVGSLVRKYVVKGLEAEKPRTT
jgi:hypothetical protein